MANPHGQGGEHDFSVEESPLNVDERHTLRVTITRRLYALTNDEMLGRDLELSAMVAWLRESLATASTDARHRNYVHKMIAQRLGPGTPREAIEDIGGRLPSDELDSIMAAVQKVPDFTSWDAKAEAIEAWSPIVEDVHYLINSVMDYSLLESEEL